MDLNTVIARVRAILITPNDEWPKIAERPETVESLYKDYLLVIMAIPAVFGFLGSHHPSLIWGLVGVVVRYVVSLGAVYVITLIVEALAPYFGGQKNRIQAFKAVAYSTTAAAVSYIAVIIPNVGPLVILDGGVYTLYLLYLGLPVLMKAPKDKAIGYTGVVFASTFAAFLVLGLIVGQVMPRPAVGDIGFDKTSLGGQLAEKAKAFEDAQKSGDVEAQKKAAGQIVGTVFAGGAVVEALAPEKIRSFLPDTLNRLSRTEASAERNEALGMQMSSAHASYSDGGAQVLTLEITDMGSAKGFAAAASWAAVEQDKLTDTGFEKTYKSAGRIVHEQWDNGTKDGEYSLILADRFAVKVVGRADGIGSLKKALEAVNLSGLEALKDEGVRQGG